MKEILEKWKKNTGKVAEFCQSEKVGTMNKNRQQLLFKAEKVYY